MLKSVGEVNPTVNLLVNLLRPPTKAECEAEKLIPSTASARGYSPGARFGVEPFHSLTAAREAGAASPRRRTRARRAPPARTRAEGG